METESTGNDVEVISEKLEHVGEAGGLNTVRVELGLSGK